MRAALRRGRRTRRDGDSGWSPRGRPERTGEAEGAGDGYVGQAQFAANPSRPGEFGLQCAQTRGQLTHHPVDPGLVLFFGWAQHTLVVALDRFFHDRQREARRPQRFQALRRFRRRQRGDARIDAGEVIKNDARIHQRRSVIGDEGRRFQERVELGEFINVPEERNWPMYKRSSADDQRNGDPAHVGRIKHSDQLHEVSAAARRRSREGNSQIARGDRGMGQCGWDETCARGPCAVTNLKARSTQRGRQKRAKHLF